MKESVSKNQGGWFPRGDRRIHTVQMHAHACAQTEGNTYIIEMLENNWSQLCNFFLKGTLVKVRGKQMINLRLLRVLAKVSLVVDLSVYKFVCRRDPSRVLPVSGR